MSYVIDSFPTTKKNFSSTECHVAVKACRQVPQAGNGQHHGHPEDQAVCRGLRGTAAVGLRGPPAEAGQRRRSQGTETALRGIRAHVQCKLH